MAFGMKAWAATAVAGCVLLALWKLPPEPWQRRIPERQPPIPEQARYSALMDDVREARTLLRRLQWSDSLAPLVVERARDGRAILIEGMDTLDAGPVGQFRARLDREVDAIPNRRPDMVLGAVVQSSEVGDHPAEWRGVANVGMGEHVFFGRRGEVGYCFGVSPSFGPPDANSLDLAFSRSSPADTRVYNLLGVCRWIGELGLPGPQIAGWLSEGGYAFADQGYLEVAGGVDGTAMIWDDDYRRRQVLGFGWDPGDWSACRAGREEACARAFGSPFESSRSEDGASAGLLADVRSPEGQHWLPLRSFLLRGPTTLLVAALYAEFGRERMEVFWTHEGDPLTAFRDAFGVEAGAWLASSSRASRSYVPPGPLPRPRDFAWALVVLAALAALAVSAGLRRRVA